MSKLCADTKFQSLPRENTHTHTHTQNKGLRKKEINLLWPQFPIFKMRMPD